MIATSLYLLREKSGSLRIFAKAPNGKSAPYEVTNEVYTWIFPKSVHEYFRRILPETGLVEFHLHPRNYAAIYTPTANYTSTLKKMTQMDKEKEAGLPVRFFIEKKAEGEFQMSVAEPIQGISVLRLNPEDRENWVWLPSKWAPYFEDLLKAYGAVEYQISCSGVVQIFETEEKIIKGLS